MDLESILKDVPTIGAKPEAPAPVPETPVERAEAPAEPTSRAPEPKPENAGYRSSRKEHRDREQAAQGRVRDPETGQFAPKGEDKPEAKVGAKVEAKPESKDAPRQELTEKERGFLKATEEERHKRQQLERELAELRGQKPPTEVAAETKTFWDDPEAYMKRLEQNIHGAALENRIYTSEQIARSKYPDFEEKKTIFRELALKNQTLVQQLIQSPDPADFAYKLAKSHKELQEVGSIDEIRAKVERETRAKVEVELKEKYEKEAQARAAERAALPASLSNVTGAAGNSRPVFSGPTSLENILKS